MNKVEILAAEVLERAVRIGLLVKISTRRLSVSFQKDTAQIAAAKQIQNLLRELVICPLLEMFPSLIDDDQHLDRVKSLLETVAAIHEGALPTVPRAIEPIELRSYLRQSGDASQSNQPLVFASERLGIQVYPNSLAGLLQRIAKRQKLVAQAMYDSTKIGELAQILLQNNKVDDSSNQQAYVAIPAVDIHNPNRWPSLWHELAHHELQEKSPSLVDAFEKHINGDNAVSPEFRFLCMEIAPLAIDDCDGVEEEVRVAAGRSLIEHWLTECWCDAYGVRQAGLAFLYAQLHDFMFCFQNYLAQKFRPGRHYPPAEFRLNIAQDFALERLRHGMDAGRAGLISGMVNDYEKEETVFRSIAGTIADYGQYSSCVSLLFSHFLAFLKQDLTFASDSTVGGGISDVEFGLLEKDLKEGLPIPYVFTIKPPGERATRVSEIVLAGWRNRNAGLREDIIKALKDATQLEGKEKQVDKLTESVSLLIDRADESIKRSIQVSEWFSVLHDADKKGNLEDELVTSLGATVVDEKIQEVSTQVASGEVSLLDIPCGLLSDDDINILLKDGNGLKIIPLIDKKQIEGSAIDLRLGHNFEVFQPLFESAIDACDGDVAGRQDSLQVEIDFLHGLPLLPGQFILGHTLEYIKLPLNVAAQIEGRSSFARLGVQIHMTANLVEAGFDGCLTLEIHNNGPATVMLYPGMRIAQLRLYKLATIPSKPYGRSGNKYRGQLSHNKTKQFTDREVPIFQKERKERGIK